MFTRRLAAAIGLLFALVGSQGPEFSQQYRQRLGGALDELKRVVAAFNADAAKQSITPVEAIARLEGNPDPLAQARGAAIESDIARRNKLQNAFDAMRDAGPVQRIGAMAADFDSAIGADTLQNFEPAVPVTSEALLVGALALVIGWGGTHVCAWPIRQRWRERREKRRAAASSRWT
jgi:Protein of unknown function (DUF2937)